MSKSARTKKRLAYKRLADKVKSSRKQQQGLEKQNIIFAAQLKSTQKALRCNAMNWRQRINELENIQRFYEARFGHFADLMENEEQVAAAYTASEVTHQGPQYAVEHTTGSQAYSDHSHEERENDEEILLPQYAQDQDPDKATLSQDDVAEPGAEDLEEEDRETDGK